MKIGNRIKFLRTKNKLSLNQLGEGVVSPTHLSNIEKGRFKPSDDIMISLSKKLEVHFTYLTNFEKFDPKVHSLLDVLLESLILSSTNTKDIVNRLSTKSINNILQETIYIMLITCYKLKNNLDIEDELFQLKFYEMNSLELTDPLLTKSFYYYNGQTFYYKEDYKKSLSYFKELLKLTHSPKLNSPLLYNLALLEYQSKYYIRAASNSLKALTNSLENHNWNTCIDLYNLLTVICWKKRDYVLAKEYALKGLEIGERYDNIELHRVYHNLGCISLEEGLLEEAEGFLNRSVSIKAQKLMNTFPSKIKLLHCYYLKQQEDKFNLIYDQLANEKKSIRDEIILKYYKALDYKKEGIEYLELLKEIYVHLKENGFIKEYKHSLELIADQLTEKNSYKQAIKYYKKLSLTLEEELL